jgi:hypothetical protein
VVESSAAVVDERLWYPVVSHEDSRMRSLVIATMLLVAAAAGAASQIAPAGEEQPIVT